jgi:hypothetical protein
MLNLRPPRHTPTLRILCALLPLPTHRTAGAAIRAEQKWAVSKWVPGAAPKPVRRARPPQSHETVSVSTTDHRDWNSLTNPHLSNGDDLTVLVRHTHGALTLCQRCQGVPSSYPSAMIARLSANCTHATCRLFLVSQGGWGPPGNGPGGGGVGGLLRFAGKMRAPIAPGRRR